MSATSTAVPARTAGSRFGVPRRRLGRTGLLLVVAGVLVAVALVRVLSGANDLTSAGTVGAALGLAVPIGMAGLGGLWSERAGVVNIGLEGMMILGTFGAGWIGWQHGPWLGVLAGVLMGAIGGLTHAVATVSFGVDHIVSGTAINLLALGATQFLASVVLTGTPGGGKTQSPPTRSPGTASIPGVGEALKGVEERRWFLVSDLAGMVRGLTTGVSLVTILALLLVALSGWVLWRTPFGLRLRSCGEEPHAAETLGVNVYLYKYIGVTVSGGLAGLGGAFLAVVSASNYREGQTAGRGFIGLAAMIFGNWRPGGLLSGAALFGYTDALQLRNADAVHALLLLLAVGLAALAVLQGFRRRWLTAAVALACGAGSSVLFFTTDTLPSQVTFTAPYITTLLVLTLASQRLRMPKADGQVYRKGSSR